ncbi:MAG: SRPBCC domain-containing protein [Acidobacteria bacterium]|nr:SRPBCC domain-containing protein [Acidobacteriota bacterium]
MNGQTVTVRRNIQASCEEVFDAWLDADGMRFWMCPGPVTSCEAVLEPHVGGRFQIVMLAPQARFVNTGEFLVLDRPSKLQFTWISSRWGRQETLVTVELHARAAGCELVLTHERFPVTHSTAQLTTGWNDMLQKLQLRLEVQSGS